MTGKRVEAAANAISEASGMRYDGFWSRVEDLEPEDRDYALKEASAALEAADAFLLSNSAVEHAARRIYQGMHFQPWEAATVEEERLAKDVAYAAIKSALTGAE
jgi:hypothetical protein